MPIVHEAASQCRRSANKQCTVRRRFGVLVASFAAAFALSACGGGGDSGSFVGFNIGVVVGGTFVSDTPVAPGGFLNVAVHAGQSLQLDAGEPVVWTMFVGGTSVTGGAHVFYAGVDIVATTLSSSAVVVDTFAASPLQAAVPITLVATSTRDSAQVATVDVLITN